MDIRRTGTVIGRDAPDFELKNVDGSVVRLSDFRGRQPVVLVLARGFR